MKASRPPPARHPWQWIPTLYYGQGIPYVVVMTISVILYKRMDISNTEIALYTSWLYLPWVIKPLWSPLVDLFRTKRFWIVVLQLFIGGALASVGLTIPLPDFLPITLALFWLMAFSSATHDIAADGFYLLALKEHQQAAFVGVRSTCYRIAMITGQGGLVYLAGRLEETTGNVPLAWSLVFFLLASLFLALVIYHQLVLPFPANDRPMPRQGHLLQDFLSTFRAFFGKKGILVILAFLLLYRFAEAQLGKLAAPFLLDAVDRGGLGLTTQQIGIVYGSFGVFALLLGGLLGGLAVSRQGLKFWLWSMVCSVNLPDLLYVFLAWVQPTDLVIITIAIAVEQFGYGFGFTAYLVYMMMVSEGAYKTAHYAICTGFMALGMMLPGMLSGWLQEQLGYANFFIWVSLATIPAFIVTALVDVDPLFGKEK